MHMAVKMRKFCKKYSVQYRKHIVNYAVNISLTSARYNTVLHMQLIMVNIYMFTQQFVLSQS